MQPKRDRGFRKVSAKRTSLKQEKVPDDLPFPLIWVEVDLPTLQRPKGWGWEWRDGWPPGESLKEYSAYLSGSPSLDDFALLRQSPPPPPDPNLQLVVLPFPIQEGKGSRLTLWVLEEDEAEATTTPKPEVKVNFNPTALTASIGGSVLSPSAGFDPGCPPNSFPSLPICGLVDALADLQRSTLPRRCWTSASGPPYSTHHSRGNSSRDLSAHPPSPTPSTLPVPSPPLPSLRCRTGAHAVLSPALDLAALNMAFDPSVLTGAISPSVLSPSLALELLNIAASPSFPSLRPLPPLHHLPTPAALPPGSSTTRSTPASSAPAWPCASSASDSAPASSPPPSTQPHSAPPSTFTLPSLPRPHSLAPPFETRGGPGCSCSR